MRRSKISILFFPHPTGVPTPGKMTTPQKEYCQVKKISLLYHNVALFNLDNPILPSLMIFKYFWWYSYLNSGLPAC
jgi:hypothetical protein